MAKKNIAGENTSKSKKRSVTPGVKRVVESTQTQSTTSRKTAAISKQAAAARTQKVASNKPPKVNNQNFVVYGQVINADKTPVVGVKVVAFDVDISGEDKLSTALTDAHGHYSISYIAAQFKRTAAEQGGPELLVRVYDENDQQIGQSRQVNNAARMTELNVEIKTAQYRVHGTVRDNNGKPVKNVVVRALDRDLRNEELLGEAQTNRNGVFHIEYSEKQFLKRERSSADLVVKGIDADGSILVASPVLFNAPQNTEIDLTIPIERWVPPTLFERIKSTVAPLLGRVKVEELEENQKHQDLSFLSGGSGFEKHDLARFVMAHSLAQQGIPAEFWFALLGGSFCQFAENQSLKEQLAALSDALPSLNAAAVRKSLTRAFNQKEIHEAFREKVADWIEAFLNVVASQSVSEAAKPTFVKSALEDAGIRDAKKQEKFARLFNEHKALTPELLATLEKDKSFKKTEIADLRTSFQLAELTRGDFSVVKMLKEEFDVRQPEKIRALAKKSESEWVSLVKEKHAAGEIKLPIEVGEIAGQIEFPAAEVYGKTLERQFREAFPTTAFIGGLERALQNGGAHGLRHAEALGRFLDGHETFELLNTPVDDFLKNNINSDFQVLAENEDFRLEVKAVQRVFKLAPSFEATDAMLADGVHSAQMAYRMGESEFVRHYEKQPGFTTDTARLAWNRAADTHAAVLTIVSDLKSLENETLPLALRSDMPLEKSMGSDFFDISSKS